MNLRRSMQRLVGFKQWKASDSMLNTHVIVVGNLNDYMYILGLVNSDKIEELSSYLIQNFKYGSRIKVVINDNEVPNSLKLNGYYLTFYKSVI